MSKPIDLTKPLEVHDSGGRQPLRTVTVLGTLLNGNFIASISGGSGVGIIFDENGDYLGCTNGSATQGSALSIRNAPPPPAKTYNLTLDAEEMALLRVLVGNCVLMGNSHNRPHSRLYQRLDLAGDIEDSMEACDTEPRIDGDSDGFKRLIAAYK